MKLNVGKEMDGQEKNRGYGQEILYIMFLFKQSTLTISISLIPLYQHLFKILIIICGLNVICKIILITTGCFFS